MLLDGPFVLSGGVRVQRLMIVLVLVVLLEVAKAILLLVVRGQVPVAIASDVVGLLVVFVDFRLWYWNSVWMVRFCRSHLIRSPCRAR